MFLLVLCLSGLPLLFADEIDDWLSPPRVYAALPADAPRASVDPMVAAARRLRPGTAIIGLSIDPDKPEVRVNIAPSLAAARTDPGSIGWLAFDARTGRYLGDSAHAAVSAGRINEFFVDLHSRFLLGNAGLIVMGTMGAVFIVALISGVALYAPFTRRLPFGTVRRDRAVRTKRLDLHNVLGIVALAWMAVVGLTGVLNELNDPLFAHWEREVVGGAVARAGGGALAPGTPLASVQAAITETKRLVPGMQPIGIGFPDTELNGPRHYMVWAHGETPATGQLFAPVMFDAVTGRRIAVLPMPWYLRAVELSRPFHFGDYGGLPLKLIWGVFDLFTIVLLVTGLQLWWRPTRRASRG